MKDKKKDPSFYHITFLAETAGIGHVKKLDTLRFLPDEFLIVEKAVYLYCPNGYGIAKLSNKFLENKLKVSATTRNWKTTKELIAIAEKVVVE